MVPAWRELAAGFDLLVFAPNDPSSAEAALACLAFGPKLVGLDWVDVQEAAGEGVGVAHVANRVFEVAAELKAARKDLAATGFGLDYALVQLVSEADQDSFTLDGLDALARGLFHEVVAPVVFTAGSSSPLSRPVLIGVGRST